ncbi:MAG: hypothetical protein ABJF04_06265 [Reichenbachiella sp.]|uniref:hypothetical protein n=1 Tax=Reichenbachiella sp. TaxID=2184521 RepID=UPI003266E8A0
MINHFDLTDNEFEIEFKNCTLSPSMFNHEAHLRLAWIHIDKYGVETAIKNLCDQLIRFVAAVGATDKYNTTLTIASVKMINHFVGQSNSSNFYDFVSEFPQLKSNFKGLISSHYGIDIFNSTKAKKEYIAPDLLPFE